MAELKTFFYSWLPSDNIRNPSESVPDNKKYVFLTVFKVKHKKTTDPTCLIKNKSFKRNFFLSPSKQDPNKRFMQIIET